MKFFKLLIFSVILAMGISACEIINPEEQIPSYIAIDSISLSTTSAQGPNTENITDAWIYVNDQPIGCFELPCRVPILKSGIVKIDIRAGIKINGISALRSIYPMYMPYITSGELKPGEILKISPTTKYDDNYDISINEQFLSSGTFFTKTDLSLADLKIIASSNPIHNGSFGEIKLNKTNNQFEIYTNLNKIIPKTGVPIFVEFDYQCDHPFTFGVYIKYASTYIKHDVIVVNTSSKWNKIYMNLTEISTREVNAIEYDLFIHSTLNSDRDSADFKLDNIRLIY